MNFVYGTTNLIRALIMISEIKIIEAESRYYKRNSGPANLKLYAISWSVATRVFNGILVWVPK